jgi:hypothetical protein
MLPFAVYTGKILLQTTPSHLITQLDKTLREASTLDGVLEFRDEHFWTLSFGVLVGSLHVRIRRDADEQLVLAHVWNKLAGLVQILTIHIFKDDWMRSRTHQLVYNQQNLNFSLNNASAQLTTPLTPNTFTKITQLSNQLPLQQHHNNNNNNNNNSGSFVFNSNVNNNNNNMIQSSGSSTQLNNRQNVFSNSQLELKSNSSMASTPTRFDGDYVIVNP